MKNDRGICSIYRITNTINGKIYVGQTWQTIKNRFAVHRSSSDCPKLYNAMEKYGRENFIIEPIVSVWDQGSANYFEDLFIDKYNSIKNGYNIKHGGSNGKHSEETKQKLREMNLGKKNPNFGKIGAYLHTEEELQKMREANSGAKNHNFGKYGELSATFGKVCSEQTKEKISKGNSGKIRSDKFKENQRQRMIGHKKSAKTIEKTSGENHPNAKLNNDKVYEIKKLLATTLLKCSEIATLFGVTKENIYHIKKGNNWKKVKYPSD